MAHSKCAGCGNHFFEVKEVSPNGAAYKSLFVQCSACGIPAGVIDYTNAGVKVAAAIDKIDKLERRLRTIEAAVVDIQSVVRRR